MSPACVSAQVEIDGEAEVEPAIKMGAPFGNHMVLQREMAVPIWGWSKPGAKVTVEFAGQIKTTTVEIVAIGSLSLIHLRRVSSPPN